MRKTINKSMHTKTQKKMRVAIRVDASWEIGTGHVMRCLALAKKLVARGHEVCLISRALKGHLIEHCLSQNIPVITLAALTPDDDQNQEPDHAKEEGQYAHWLGVSQETDAAQCIQALSSFHPDWTVVDHYALDKTWQNKMGSSLNAKILAIDDLAQRQHDCDILLDHNPWPNKNERYQHLIPDRATCLLGPKYALLRERFAQLKKRPPPKIHNQVFVFFSGTDPTGENLKLLNACQSFSSLPFQLKVVFGMTNPMKNQLMALPCPDFVTLIESLPDFEGELAASRYAFGSAGVTAIERACLNVPSTLVCLAQNQHKMAEHLAHSGQCRYLGRAENTGVQSYVDEITWLVKNGDTWPEMLNNSEIDGLGTDRVVKIMED